MWGRGINFGFAVLLLCGGAGASDRPVVSMRELVVSASQIPTRLQDTPVNATIITRAEIEARQPVDVVDLLRQVGGAHIVQPGGPGGVSSIYIRAGEANFAVVLIDGVKVNDPTNSRGGSYDFSTLDIAAIERIEIVRGPLSTVYGSDAMGGAINIITREGTAETQVGLHGAVGRFDYYRTGVEARGPLGGERRLCY